MSRGRIVMVTSGFPRRSETFALGELLALEARGLLAAIYATKPGDGAGLQPGCERLLRRVRFLPDAPPAAQAAALVESLGGQTISGIHGYFAHQPAEVAQLAAKFLKLPFGFSTHARDARKVTAAELARRAREAACVVACNTDVAEEINRTGKRVHLLPHGVDTERFRPRPLPPASPLRVLAVGRLVEKKGFEVLIRAAARLAFDFRLRIIGEGPLRDRLASLINATEMHARITLGGARTHAELPDEYANAHVVVAPSVIDSTGDRDGLPNVILEAMASRRTVVASDLSAIASAVRPEETGILVPPGDAAALAASLGRVAREAELCAQLARQARKHVEREFDVKNCAGRFCDFLESVYA